MQRLVTIGSGRKKDIMLQPRSSGNLSSGCNRYPHDGSFSRSFTVGLETRLNEKHEPCLRIMSVARVNVIVALDDFQE